MKVTTIEAKEYLRVDYDDDDALIQTLVSAAEEKCREICRIDADADFPSDDVAKAGILYTVAYMYENWDKADMRQLDLILRALFSGARGVKF